MQQEIREILNYAARAATGNETDPSEIIEDFGFNHDPHTVLSCWFALRSWNVLPVAGGWLDQPLTLRDDLNTIQAIYNEEADALQQRIPDIDEFQMFDDKTGAEIKLGL